MARQIEMKIREQEGFFKILNHKIIVYNNLYI